MTFVHSSSGSALSRSDDGAALQRRLMQDLERQWLDSWTVADQMQAQAAPAPTPEDQPQTPAQNLAKSQPISQAGTSPGAAIQRTKPTTPVASVGGVSKAPTRDAGERTNATTLAVSHQMTTAGTGGAQIAATPALRESKQVTQIQGGHAPQGDSAPELASEGNGPPSPQEVAARALPARPVGTPLQQSPTVVSTIETAAEGVARSIPAQATDAVSASAASKSQPMGATPSVPRVASDSESTEKEAASAPRQGAKAPQDKADAGPRRLMLRETDVQSVLASMRDTELTSSQSQIAADGLARALMEAGYARIQVVVNGQQHRDERRATNPKAGLESPMNDQPQSSNTIAQERLDGR